MTKTCITGCNGFIGLRLFWALRKRGETPTSILHSDIRVTPFSEYERIFFLSTYGNMAHHQNGMVMLKANIIDVISMLRSNINSWICFMSSSSVLLPVQTRYSHFKRAAEETILGFQPACIVRPFSVTGVGEQKEHLIPTLIRSCFEGEEMTFDPSPTHDFIDVSDVCDALIRLADDKATGIYEFGNRIAISNEEVRRLVEEVTGRKANITEVKPLRPYDNEDWCCKTQNKYWQPTKSLRQSITEMVSQYRNEHSV